MNEVKNNESLVKFNSLISGTQGTGIFLTLGGFITVLVGLSTPSWLSLGVWLVSSGVLTFNLAQLGKFLRQTALTIVEGSGGNITAEKTDDYLSKPGSAPSKQSFDGLANQSKLIGTLTSGEYDAWINAGQPPLEIWDEAGRPSFREWLKSQA